MPPEIEIELNGFPEKIPFESNLSHLIARHGDGDVHLIVEVNGRFIYPQKYGETLIRKGDRVELINPNWGG